jgi:hypothetical protein
VLSEISNGGEPSRLAASRGVKATLTRIRKQIGAGRKPDLTVPTSPHLSPSMILLFIGDSSQSPRDEPDAVSSVMIISVLKPVFNHILNGTWLECQLDS